MNAQRPGIEPVDFETLLALEDQVSRERWEQIKAENPAFAAWLNARRSSKGGKND